VQQESTRQNHRCSRSSGIPCATVLTLIRDLPGDRLSCPRPCAMRSIVASWRQHRDARTTRLHVRNHLRSSCAVIAATASPPRVS
jgi:hypothetical protein